MLAIRETFNVFIIVKAGPAFGRLGPSMTNTNCAGIAVCGPSGVSLSSPGLDCKLGHGMVLLRFAIAFRRPFQESQILRLLFSAALRMPKLTIAVALLALAALAGTMSYTGFLVVGVLAEQLGTGRVIAGLLLGGFFARFPWISQGKLRTVGLLPKPLRRPIIVSLLALCWLSFLVRGEYVSALFIGFAVAFLLTFPWMRRALFGRMVSSLFKSATGQNPPKNTDDRVIDVEFREKKD